MPAVNYARRFNSQSDLDEVFLSRQNTPNSATKTPLRADCFKFSSEANRSLEMIIDDDGALSPSLKEFEKIESKSQTGRGPVSPYVSDDVFMFTPSPNSFANIGGKLKYIRKKDENHRIGSNG